MDLSKIVHEPETSVELTHPGTGAPLGITIRILGQDSTVYRRVSSEQQDKRLAQLMKRGTAKPLTAEQAESDTIERLATCTTGWTGLEKDGTSLPYSLDNARDLYRTHAWIREQLDEAIVDRSRFFKKELSNS